MQAALSALPLFHELLGFRFLELKAVRRLHRFSQMNFFGGLNLRHQRNLRIDLKILRVHGRHSCLNSRNHE